jgi:hypothetical protein
MAEAHVTPVDRMLLNPMTPVRLKSVMTRSNSNGRRVRSRHRRHQPIGRCLTASEKRNDEAAQQIVVIDQEYLAQIIVGLVGQCSE